MDPRAERIYGAAEYLRQQLGDLRPEIGIVLGSGLGKLADSIAEPLTIPYKTIPGFPVSTAIGHKGNFIVGKLGGKTLRPTYSCPISTKPSAIFSAKAWPAHGSSPCPARAATFNV
jgi:purine nucleoside phosphorylase